MHAVTLFADSQSTAGFVTVEEYGYSAVDFHACRFCWHSSRAVRIGATCLGGWSYIHIVVGRPFWTLLAWYGWIIAGLPVDAS